MAAYIGLLHKDADSDYGVSFPDFPGCVTAGASLDEARKFAAEALELHVEGMIEDGEAIPEPSSLDEVMALAEAQDAVAVLVDLARRKSRAVRVNVTIDEDTLRRVDAYAEEHGTTRSGFLARAARAELRKVAG